MRKSAIIYLLRKSLVSVIAVALALFFVSVALVASFIDARYKLSVCRNKEEYQSAPKAELVVLAFYDSFREHPCDELTQLID